MGDVEALALYGRIRIEGHVQTVAGRHDRVRQTAATQSTQLAAVGVVTVEDFQTVVRALHVRLELEVVECLRVYVVTIPITVVMGDRRYGQGGGELARRLEML